MIQKAGQLALAAGAKFDDVLAIAGRIRAKYPETPLIHDDVIVVTTDTQLEDLRDILAE